MFLLVYWAYKVRFFCLLNLGDYIHLWWLSSCLNVDILHWQIWRGCSYSPKMVAGWWSRRKKQYPGWKNSWPNWRCSKLTRMKTRRLLWEPPSSTIWIPGSLWHGKCTTWFSSLCQSSNNRKIQEIYIFFFIPLWYFFRCKKFDVPIEKIYNKTQRDKFAWAIEMTDEDFEF